MLTKKEKIGAALEGMGVAVSLLSILWAASLFFPAFRMTLIGKVPFWVIMIILIFGFLSCMAGEKIIKKEAKRNRFC